MDRLQTAPDPAFPFEFKSSFVHKDGIVLQIFYSFHSQSAAVSKQNENCDRRQSD